jgi:sulfur carrier protein
VQIVVNGDQLAVLEGETVAGLLARLGLGAKWVLVERNGEPVNRTDVPSTVLADGDRLELVRAVAGG